MAEKLFALSEDTKNKVLELIGRKPAPDKYANKTPTMREYYSRMWVVKLDEDLPGMYDDRSGNNNLNCVDAYVFEVNEYKRLAQRVWNSENVKLRKKVYNQSRETLPANDEGGNPIFYTAIQDMLGTIWVQPRVKEPEYFIINYGNDGTQTATNDYSVYTKGSLHYIYYNTTYNEWFPVAGNEGTPPSDPTPRLAGTKLVVCQVDAPNSAAEFHMPYFTPESNIGVPPKISTYNEGYFGKRCGVLIGEHEFSDSSFDYLITGVNGSGGSVVSGTGLTFAYQPQFIEVVQVDGNTGGGHTPNADIFGQTWDVGVPTPSAGLSRASYPDIYPGDVITVLVDFEGQVCTALDYSTDFPENEIIVSYNNPSGRGWDSTTTPSTLSDIGLYLYIKVKTGAIT